jgi:hypothetical protein
LVRAVRERALAIEGTDVILTCSIGWSYFPFGQLKIDALDWNEVLRLADAGLYLAKREGRDRAVGVLPGRSDLAPEDLEAASRDLDAAFASGALVPVRFSS